MKQSTAKITEAYIKEHPYIKNCLKKGLINYSALARLICKERNIAKKTSQEAVLVAARRFQEKLKGAFVKERKIKALLSKSEMGIKNKIDVLVLDKNIDVEMVIELQKEIKKASDVMYLLEGTNDYTLIASAKYVEKLVKKFKHSILKHHCDLTIIYFRSSEHIEKTPGVVSYLTSLLAENDVNILELISCWRNTIFVLGKKDLSKAMDLLDL